MNYFISFLVFIIVERVFTLLIKKFDLSYKLVNKRNNYKYFKLMLGSILIIFTFLLEYEKQLLNHKYGHLNYMSIIVSAFLCSIYINFIPLIFRRSES